MELQLSMSPSNEYSGLISFRMDWLDLVAVQGTLKSLFQHHSSKTSILRSSAFFMVQLSHPYMTTGKIIALTIWTFVAKVMSLLLNILFRFAIAFFPRRRQTSFNFMANRWGNSETVADFILGGSKITADGDCSHEIKRCLLPGRKVMTNLDAY